MKKNKILKNYGILMLVTSAFLLFLYLLSYVDKLFVVISGKMAILLVLGTLISVGVYFYGKQRDKVLLWSIIISIVLLLFSFTSPLATVFNPSGIIGDLPQTQEECREIEGIVLPTNLDCGKNYVEIGGSENFICCIEDTCDGEWRRVYNEQTKLYEKFCFKS